MVIAKQAWEFADKKAVYVNEYQIHIIYNMEVLENYAKRHITINQ